jgi:hypothetical protein
MQVILALLSWLPSHAESLSMNYELAMICAKIPEAAEIN